jgi:hypothetical protein
LLPKECGGILGEMLKIGRVAASVKIENLTSPDKKTWSATG